MQILHEPVAADRSPECEGMASPAIKCPLQLVRLEPLKLDGTDAAELIVYYATDSQRFGRRMSEGTAIMLSEHNFDQVVKKEPERYVAKNPFRGVAKLGSKQYAFVLDKNDENTPGYDRLYFDISGNGDLTGIKPLEGTPDPREASLPPGDSGDSIISPAWTWPSTWTENNRIILFSSLVTHILRRRMKMSMRIYHRLFTARARLSLKARSGESPWWIGTATAGSTA